MDNSSRSQKASTKESDMALAAKASRAAFRKLVEERRRLGGTIIIWKDGRVQYIPASEVVLPEV